MINKLIGIDNVKGDIFKGLIFGVSLILANILGIFSLALPPIASFSTNIGKLLVVVILAPVVEEIFFRGVVSSYFRNIFKSKNLSDLLQASVFGVYHLVAYTGITLEAFDINPVIAVGGSFVGAILFGFISAKVVRKYNNLIVGIIAHAIINAWLVSGTLFIIG